MKLALSLVAAAIGRSTVGNGANGSTQITDSSMWGLNWVPHGSAQISTAASKFGGSSIKLDGSAGCYVSAPAGLASAMAFGSNDWTVEFWINNGVTTATQNLILDWRTGAASNQMIFIDSDGKLKYYLGYAIRITGTTNFHANAGTWYHVAVTRASGTTRLFINGTQEGSSYTDGKSYTAAAPNLGADSGGSALLTGYIDDLRIVNGMAKYTTTFTPPTAELPNR